MKWQTRKHEASDIYSSAAKDKVIYTSLTPQEAIHNLLVNTQQLQTCLGEVYCLISNKKRRNDFSASEWDKFVDCLQQALYIDHSVKRLLRSMKIQEKT
jgi:hypothetical protein